jgi:2-hydroxychromene-2-carboxylate isomerase
MHVLRFYFDFISPYAYLGWLRVHEVAQRQGLEVEPIPVLLAALLHAHGQKGPAEIPPKRLYTFKHVVRLAHDQGAPIDLPPSHPFNPLLGLRIASLPMSSSERRRTIDVLYALTWAQGRGITDATVVADALDRAGLPGASFVEQATTPEAKAALRSACDAAIDRGVFGVPTMEIGDERFWGQDSFSHIERFVQGHDPVDAQMAARVDALRPSATRTSR